MPNSTPFSNLCSSSFFANQHYHIMSDDAVHYAILSRMNHLSDPISRIPYEIALKIFKECIPAAIWPPRLEKYLSLVDATLFVLGAVCKIWRQIIWNTPGFWESIFFVFHPWHPDEIPTFIKEWMKRAAGLPLSVKIFVHCLDYVAFSEVATRKRFVRVSSLITASSSWIVSLSLEMPTPLVSFFKRPESLKKIYLGNN